MCVTWFQWVTVTQLNNQTLCAHSLSLYLSLSLRFAHITSCINVICCVLVWLRGRTCKQPSEWVIVRAAPEGSRWRPPPVFFLMMSSRCLQTLTGPQRRYAAHSNVWSWINAWVCKLGRVVCSFGPRKEVLPCLHLLAKPLVSRWYWLEILLTSRSSIWFFCNSLSSLISPKQSSGVCWTMLDNAYI